MLPNKFHNKVVEIASNTKLSRIPLPYNHVLKIGKSMLKCTDAHKGCDFGVLDIEERYTLLTYNLKNSSFPLIE